MSLLERYKKGCDRNATAADIISWIDGNEVTIPHGLNSEKAKIVFCIAGYLIFVLVGLGMFNGMVKKSKILCSMSMGVFGIALVLVYYSIHNGRASHMAGRSADLPSISNSFLMTVIIGVVLFAILVFVVRAFIIATQLWFLKAQPYGAIAAGGKDVDKKFWKSNYFSKDDWPQTIAYAFLATTVFILAHSAFTSDNMFRYTPDRWCS